MVISVDRSAICKRTQVQIPPVIEFVNICHIRVYLMFSRLCMHRTSFLFVLINYGVEVSLALVAINSILYPC